MSTQTVPAPAVNTSDSPANQGSVVKPSVTDRVPIGEQLVDETTNHETGDYNAIGKALSRFFAVVPPWIVKAIRNGKDGDRLPENVIAALGGPETVREYWTSDHDSKGRRLTAMRKVFGSTVSPRPSVEATKRGLA